MTLVETAIPPSTSENQEITYEDRLQGIHNRALELHEGELSERFYLPTGQDNSGSDMRLRHVDLQSASSVVPVYGHNLYLDFEFNQPGGAFKAHGARAAILRIVMDLESNKDASESGVQHTVTTGSAGNHANSLAVNCLEFGLISESYVPDNISPQKESALGVNGSYVIHSGQNVTSAINAAEQAELSNSTVHFIHPYDNDEVLAGQETIALDTLDDLERQGFDLLHDPIVIPVPVGGGGNLVGFATALWQARQDGRIGDNVKLYAVEVYDEDDGELYSKSSSRLSWCDGTNTLTSEIAEWVQDNPEFCAGTVYVKPHEVADAMDQLTRTTGRLIEPAGALGTAAAKLLAAGYDRPGDGIPQDRKDWRDKVVTFVTQVTGAKISRAHYDEIMNFRTAHYRGKLEQLAVNAWGQGYRDMEPSDEDAYQQLHGCVRYAS